MISCVVLVGTSILCSRWTGLVCLAIQGLNRNRSGLSSRLRALPHHSHGGTVDNSNVSERRHVFNPQLERYHPFARVTPHDPTPRSYPASATPGTPSRLPEHFNHATLPDRRNPSRLHASNSVTELPKLYLCVLYAIYTRALAVD